MNTQFASLALFRRTGRIAGLDDDIPHAAIELEDPLKKNIEALQLEAARAELSGETSAFADSPLQKFFAELSQIDGSVLAKGVARTEDEPTASGGIIRRSYDGSGELVRVQLLDGDADAGLLQKRDLSKRSSARSLIRLEKQTIDTDDGPEDWVFGYDHEGACVYTRCGVEEE